jgi:hypothetical protein
LFPFGGRRRPAPPGTVTRERRCAPSSHQNPLNYQRALPISVMR